MLSLGRIAAANPLSVCHTDCMTYLGSLTSLEHRHHGWFLGRSKGWH